MSKVVNGLILMFIIEVSIYLWGGSTISSTIIQSLAQNPADLGNSALYSFFTNPISLAVASSVIIGGLILLKNDLAIYASFAAAAATFMIVLTDLWKFMYGQLVEYFGINTWMICSIVTIPILIQFGYSLLAIVGNRKD